jgi:putative ABC transport system substrate-binding protein
MNLKKVAVAALTAVTLGFICSAPQAQQTGKVYRVGALFNRGANPEGDAFRKGMAQLGYIDGTNVIFEARFAEGQLDRLPGFAAELVAKGVDVIATFGGPATTAARKATSTIPTAAALVADPVAIGIAATLDRPGGNITGVTNNDPELAGLQLAILKKLSPKLARVAILSDSDIPGADASGLAPIERANVAAARAIGVVPQVVKVRGVTPDLDTAFKSMVGERADALIVLEVPAPIRSRARVAELATAHRIPTMFWGGEFGADSGGLFAYGTGIDRTYQRVPNVIDKILKGAKPAETPFEVLSKRELVINLKTARGLGVPIPAELLKRADRVIE